MQRSFHGQELAGVIGLGLSLALWLLSSWRLIYHTVWGRKQRQRSSSGHGRRGSFLTTSPESTPRQRQQQQQQQQQQDEEVNSSSLEGSEGAPLMIRGEEQGEQQQQQQQQRQRRRIVSKWFTRRRTFHCLLWMATACEALAYADLSGLLVLHHNRIFASKLGYILLDVVGRSILELLAFSTVTAIWLQTSINASIPLMLISGQPNQGRRKLLLHYIGPIFAIVIFLLVLSSAAVSFVVFFSHEHDDLSTIQRLSLFKAQTLLESVSWGVHSLVVLECAIMTSKRITKVVPRTQYRKRISLLCKAVIPMIGTAILYMIRCGWLVAVYCNSTSKLYGRGSWSWWIGFMWCPTWMAIIMLLYSARKRDQYHNNQTTTTTPTSNTTGINNALLLRQPLLPRPPAEAFLAFSHHRNIASEEDADLEDDSLFCSPYRRGVKSPMFVHVYANNNNRQDSSDDTGVVADEETLTTESITNNDYNYHHHHHHHHSPRKEGLTITETETFDDDDDDEALNALISEAKVCEDALAKEIQEFNEILEGSGGDRSSKTSDVSGGDSNKTTASSEDVTAAPPEKESFHHNNNKEDQQDKHHQVDLEKGRPPATPSPSTIAADLTAATTSVTPAPTTTTTTTTTNWVFYEDKGNE